MNPLFSCRSFKTRHSCCDRYTRSYPHVPMIQLLRSFLLSSPHYQIFKKALEHPVAPTISSRPLNTSRLPGEDHQQRWHAAGKVHALPPNPVNPITDPSSSKLTKIPLHARRLHKLAHPARHVSLRHCHPPLRQQPTAGKTLSRRHLPSPGSVVHIGYSGVCIQTPENPEPWTCSRFIKGTHGFNEQELTLIKSVKSMQ
jgi:hypothetical protein